MQCDTIEFFRDEPHSVRSANFVHMYSIKLNKSLTGGINKQIFYYNFNVCEDAFVNVEW